MTEPTINAGFFKGATELVDKLMDTGSRITDEKRKLVDKDGHTYYWDGSKYVELIPKLPEDEPYASPLEFFTLRGIVDYITENTEDVLPDAGKLIMQVIDWEHVVLWSQPTKNYKIRHVIAQCKAHAPTITFSRYQSVDVFNTMLLSTFIQTENLQTLFQVIKSMTKEQSLNTTDDGVTQQINVKSGITTAATVNFKNPVPLAPMRTFTEIEQPESNFVMRINEDAEVALFEADGGAWKNQAVERIKKYLQTELKNKTHVVVIA